MAGRPGFGERELSMLPEEVAKSTIRGGRVAIAGLGTVGRAVARALDRGAIPGLSLTTVAVRDAAKARLVDEFLGLFGGRMQPVMAQLIEAGNLTPKDVQDAEKLLRDLSRKKREP